MNVSIVWNYIFIQLYIYIHPKITGIYHILIHTINDILLILFDILTYSDKCSTSTSTLRLYWHSKSWASSEMLSTAPSRNKKSGTLLSWMGDDTFRGLSVSFRTMQICSYLLYIHLELDTDHPTEGDNLNMLHGSEVSPWFCRIFFDPKPLWLSSDLWMKQKCFQACWG